MIFLILTSCKSKSIVQKAPKQVSHSKIEFIKMDSISEYYILYFKDFSKIYKVISKKNLDLKIKNKARLKLGHMYHLNLIQVHENYDTSGFNITNYLSLKRCVLLYPSIEICNEPGIELFLTDSLVGNYYRIDKLKLDYKPSFEVKRNQILE